VERALISLVKALTLENKCVYAKVTYNGEGLAGKLVGFEVLDAQNSSVIQRVEETNETGDTVIFFRVPQNGPPEHIIGTWTIIATVSVNQQTFSDTLSFHVTGIMIDLYTQRDGIGPDQPSDAFAPQEEVIFYAFVTYNYDAAPYKVVGFEILDADGKVFDFRTCETDVYGIASITMRIPTTPSFGIWYAVATVEVLGFYASDTVTFRVGWIIEITDVKTANRNGEIVSKFSKGERINFIVHVQNIAFTLKVGTITAVWYDECKIPIGHALLNDWPLPPNSSQIFIVGTEIPDWSHIGIGIVYVNAYTDLPILNGTAYFPEASIMFQIKC
jgi:hypothetical protein